MEDIRLDDSIRLEMNPDGIDHSDMLSPEIPKAGPSRSQPQDGIAIEMPRQDSDSSSHYFDKRSPRPSPPTRIKASGFMPKQTPADEVNHSLSQSVPAPVAHPIPDPPVHDRYWKSLYLVSMAGMFATGFLSWIQTDEHQLSKLIDTVHTAIHSHIHLLAVDSVIAVAVSLAWMYLLRRFVKLLIYSLLVSVPIILTAMSIWPLVQSYKGKWGGNSSQDKAMRWASIVPAFMSVMWIWMAYRGRNAMGRAMAIIQLSCKILGENPALIMLSFGTLLGTIVFTWMWVGMFQSVFLYGRVGTVRGVPVFYLDWSTWALGVYFIIMYLWTLGVLSGFQRAASAATVSQWYFYRHAIPAVSSEDVMDAAVHHSTTILFGTICFSSFAALMIRLPILVLPRGIAGFVHMFCFHFIASPIATLTHPLTLTYAAVHSQPLIYSSRAISSMRFIDTSGFGGSTHHPRAAYRLAKMLLSGTRAVMALSLGVAAWINTTRGGGSVGASLYGYIVGMIAGAIGWAVLGTTEGCLGNVVDACLVCVGSEPGEGSHCREAQMVFGG
ncbi:hypothetical protein BDZ91DRAFT_771793 [Kalaharituber pfeilii]|nr:hypothetical protein BDZ91DRAFT_771793 [Kalaharituber pfeilii]